MFTGPMIAPLLSLILASAAPPPPNPGNDILVIGHKIADLKQALQDCLARRCPPNEDIDASLALAETQLLDGKYHDARKVLLGALSRNKGEADAYPIPVSDLYRANGKVAASLGFDRDYYNSTWAIYQTLKHGLPSEKDRQYSAMMEVAEMMYRTRGHTTARYYYERLINRARRDGRPDIAALAELREVIRHLPPYMQEGEIKRILSKTDPKLKVPIIEGKLALARMAYADKDTAKGDAIVRELAYLNIKQPILIYSPEYTLHMQDDQAFSVVQQDPPSVGGGVGAGATSLMAAPNEGSGSALGIAAQTAGMNRLALNTEDMWVDVTFQITPEGKVSNVAIARKRGSAGWATPLLNSIRGRRYTPVAVDNPAGFRRERYTYTSGLETGASTHLSLHSPNARVEYMDLSDIAAQD
jgi:hypothetical protein